MALSGTLFSFFQLWSQPSLAADAIVPARAALADTRGRDQGPAAQPDEETRQSPSAVESARSDSSDLTRVQFLSSPSDVRVVAQLFDESPDLTVCTAILAGSADDPDGVPGVQRVLAEILVDGGYRSSSDDYASIVRQRGGTSRVAVHPDATVYCTTVPRAEVELAFWVTAGRFSAAALTADNLDEAVHRLGLVAEQRDADVYDGRAPVRLRSMAFLGSPALGHPALPSPESLEAITLDTLRQVHERTYGSQRAVVAVVGGGESGDVQHAIDKYLVRVPAGAPLAASKEGLVVQKTMRFSMDEDRSAKVPAAWYGWVATDKKRARSMHAALSILLGQSRLPKTILAPGGVGKRLTLHFPLEPTNQPTLAELEVIGRFNHSLGVVEKTLAEQLRLLAHSGPTQPELTRYADELAALERATVAAPLDRAAWLSRGLLHGFSVDKLLAPLGTEYSPVLPSEDEIRTAAAEWLIESQRSVVEVYPKGWQDPWQAPMPLFHIVEKGQTLSSIAHKYGTSVAVVVKMNGINERKPIYPGDKLKVPRGKQHKERAARSHQVRRGDTLSQIAVKYGIKVRDIAAANGMGSRQTIRIGETLTIPWPTSDSKKDDEGSGSGKGPSAAGSGSSTHKVSAGETLSGIAKHYGVSTVALARANGISHRALVKIGQELRLPSGASAQPAGPSFVTYTVKSGDTLSAIAKKHGVSVAELTVENQMSRKATIVPGQKLKIPRAAP